MKPSPVRSMTADVFVDLPALGIRSAAPRGGGAAKPLRGGAGELGEQISLLFLFTLDTASACSMEPLGQREKAKKSGRGASKTARMRSSALALGNRCPLTWTSMSPISRPASSARLCLRTSRTCGGCPCVRISTSFAPSSPEWASSATSMRALPSASAWTGTDTRAVRLNVLESPVSYRSPRGTGAFPMGGGMSHRFSEYARIRPP
mmetsp:Transcript_54336/g.143061  ORF Transcript_54336/g.143061 Transcript_54336/m.143061 type:complete len:206 (+) Transcript_54336:364-981(+)